MSNPPFRSAKWLTRAAQTVCLLMGPLMVLYWILITRAVDGDVDRTVLAPIAPFAFVTTLAIWSLALAWLRRIQRNVIALGGSIADTRVWILFVRGPSRLGSFQERLAEIYAESADAPHVETQAETDAARQRMRLPQILFAAAVAVMFAGLVGSRLLHDAPSLLTLSIIVAGVLCLVSTAMFARFLGDVNNRLDRKAARRGSGDGEWARHLSAPSQVPVPRARTTEKTPIAAEPDR